MSFLAPLYLALAGAIAVPLLLHLLRRRIGARIEFPAARYLARAEQEHSRSLKLRNLLLMLLRVLIVLALAIAAARPVTRWVGAGHAPTALALVVDNSLSSSAIVDGRRVLDQLKAMARDVLDAATSTDRLWLVTADGRVRGGSAAALRSELDRLEPIESAGNLQLAVSRAASAVRAVALDARQVAILTDGQRSAWAGNYDVGDAQVLLYVPSGKPPVNRAVSFAEARPHRWTPRGAVLARFLSRDSTTYRIAIGGRSLARGTAAPNEEVTLNAAPPERGWVSGTVEIEPDEMPADNVRHFAVWLGAAPGVAVLPGAGPFTRSAVDVLRSNQRVAEGRDIAIASGDETFTLPALIVAPTDPVRIGAANRALERLGVPWRFGAAQRAQETVRGGGLEDITVSLRYSLVPQSGAVADTLATVGRDPWIVAGPRYVVVGSPFTPDASTLPVKASFVPWLASVLTERLVGEPGQVLQAAPGARLPKPVWADALETASGSRETLGDALEVPAQAGVYFLDRNGRRVGAVVADPEPDESQLDRIPVPELERRFRARGVAAAPDRARWTALAFRSASRRSLIEPLLILAFALLAVEAVLVRAGTPRMA